MRGPQIVSFLLFLCAVISSAHGDDRTDRDAHLTLLAKNAFESPVQIVTIPDGTGALAIVERGGDVRTFKDGKVQRRRLVSLEDIADREKGPGLLAVVFPDDYLTQKIFYVYYADQYGDRVTASLKLTAEDRADEDTLKPIAKLVNTGLLLPGGGMTNGPNKSLLVAVSESQQHTSKLPSSMTGKILRVVTTPLGGSPFSIVADDVFSSNALFYDKKSNRVFVSDCEKEDSCHIKFGDLGEKTVALQEGPRCDAPPCELMVGFMYHNSASKLDNSLIYSDCKRGHIYAARQEEQTWVSERIGVVGEAVAGMASDGNNAILTVTKSGSLYKLQ